MAETAQLARQARNALGLIGVTLALALVALFWPRDAGPPDIQGALLPEPRAIPAFELTDHQGRDVTGDDLKGRWHLLSYGYTHCPDICPTTLFEVAQFRERLQQEPRFNNLQVLFYTVDPGRDTQARLADYVPWFDAGFIGLRAPTDADAQAFETGLGITATVNPAVQPENYQVAHGMMLYLLNDQGKLQAALKPTREMDGSQYFEPDQLLQDYLAIRRWSEGG